ncbi:class I SAM-dependent rRNA methyltransferase [Pendulispora brunnea]|uniref:Class I SAM-dependent rRNA methyltransferase n=1 Tax=Pendulispora brunnea TaxID=2905690 RepID=A0ABZ2K9U0_9BACT
MPTVHLKPGHVQPVWAGHPWIYAQAIHRMDGGVAAGDEVSVLDPRGNLLGRGFYSPGSSIPVRLLVRDAETPLDAAFFREKLERALTWRARLGLPSREGEKTTGYRLVHAEGDGLPGLIVDRFDDVLAVQFLTSGMKRREDMVLSALEQLLAPRAIVDRTPAATAKHEGFTANAGIVRGEADAQNREAGFAFYERGLSFRIPFELGQKTGYYFDQRGLRARVEQLALGRSVLDAYSFVGPFALAAARGGANSVTSVDESGLAIQVAESCARDNGLEGRINFVKADARKALRDAGNEGGHDLVIVDPPRLAPTRGSREGALMAYAKLAELGCRATKPGGDLILCSCSSAVDMQALTRSLAIGALHANMQAFIWERAFQGADHPVSAAFPEGLYLKALLARIEKR